MKPAPGLEPADVTARLKAASDLADLRPGHRLDAKIDLRPEAITARLQIAAELRELCLSLAQAGARAGGLSRSEGRPTPSPSPPVVSVAGAG